VWNIRQGTKLTTLIDGDNRSPVSALQLRPNPSGVSTALAKTFVAAGYEDGVVRIWNIDQQALQSAFSGHRQGVTCFNFNTSGTLLVSGSQDTTLIIWDLLSESGLYKLRGHKGTFLNTCCSSYVLDPLHR
jgi:U3 small nucleolar RNA-associated protein 12